MHCIYCVHDCAFTVCMIVSYCALSYLSVLRSAAQRESRGYRRSTRGRRPCLSLLLCLFISIFVQNDKLWLLIIFIFDKLNWGKLRRLIYFSFIFLFPLFFFIFFFLFVWIKNFIWFFVVQRSVEIDFLLLAMKHVSDIFAHLCACCSIITI